MNTIKRSRTNKVIAGVCGGLGDYTGLNPWLFRILFILFSSGFLVYLLMWAFIKKDNI